MAYNNYYPAYSPSWYGQFYQPVQQPLQPQIVPQMAQFQQQTQQAQQPMQPVTAQMQGGFIRVPSEDVARNWNVAPGTSATFINENAPYCYTKTVEMSQLDRPRFEKYRLVKEEDDASVGHENAPQATVETGGGSVSEYALKTDLDGVWTALGVLERRIDAAERKRLKKKDEKEGVDDAESAD